MTADVMGMDGATSRMRAATAAVGMATIVCVAYMAGANRPLDVDGSLSFATFIRTPSLLDPFRRQISGNNHPLFSFVEHLVYSAGFTSPAAMRVVPVLFAAGTVALLVWQIARRYGLMGGLVGGVVLAANPIYVGLARSPRGYSMAVFFVVVATMLLPRLLGSARNTLVEVAYVLALAVATGTHLYAGGALVVHAGVLLSRRELDRRWVSRVALAGILGLLPYVWLLDTMRVQSRGRRFWPGFPAELARFLLGQRLAAAALLVVVLLTSQQRGRRDRDVRAAFVAFAVVIAIMWLAAQPYELFPRMFVWGLPGAAYLVGRSVSRSRPRAALALIAASIMSTASAPTWTAMERPVDEVASILEQARARGADVCFYEFTNQALADLDTGVKVIDPDDAAACDLITAVEWVGVTKIANLRSKFTHEGIATGSQVRFHIFWNHPLPENLAPVV